MNVYHFSTGGPGFEHIHSCVITEGKFFVAISYAKTRFQALLKAVRQLHK